jgi:LmbE family N-acetylglucosaminyl deacetylase
MRFHGRSWCTLGRSFQAKAFLGAARNSFDHFAASAKLASGNFMKLLQPNSDLYVPQLGLTVAEALSRTTDLCIAAHQDDIEIMAYAGIADCYGRPDRWFSGVVVTNGAGSSRTGEYAGHTDEQMQIIRREEQRKAAHLGDYSIQAQLAYPSSEAKKPAHPGIQQDLHALLSGMYPQTVYLHQPADKHDTHIGVLLNSIEALRRLPEAQRPKRVLGCEVWRDLDWLPDSEKQALDSGRRPHLAAALLGVFDSQIAGGKRYDLGTIGRRSANATYHNSHASDKLDGITWAMDLSPLITNPGMDVVDFTSAALDRFKEDVVSRLRRHSTARK